MMAKGNHNLVLITCFLSKGKLICLEIWVGKIFATSCLCWHRNCSGEIMKVMHHTNEHPELKICNYRGSLKCGSNMAKE